MSAEAETNESLHVTLPWAVVFSTAVIALGALNYYLLVEVKDKVIANETLRQQHVARLLEGSVDAVLSQAEGVLLEVRENLRNDSFNPQFDDYLKAESGNNDVLQAILVRDSDGTPLKTSDSALPGMDDGAPEFFATHTDDKSLLYVSPPMRNPINGEWQIWLSVPGEGSGVGLESIITAAIDSHFIASHLMPVEGTEYDANTLVDSGLALVARMPWPADRIGESLKGYPLYELLKSSGEESAVAKFTSSFSGTDRLGVAHWIFGRRFIISSSRRMDAILAGWTQTAWITAIGSLAILCLVGAMWWRAAREGAKQRAANEVLRESERRFRLLINGVTDYAIFMLDPDGRIANWNAGAERIKGYSAAEIVGQHVSKFYTEDDRRNGIPQHSLDHARREGRHESEGWRVRKDGKRFWANVLVQSIRENGELIGFAKITRDVTERHKIMDDLRAAMKKAEEGAAAKTDFQANMSHEIRTPLTSIIGYTRLALQENGLSETARLYVKRVLIASDALGVIIDDVLDFSKLEAGELRFESAPFSSREFVDNCVSIVRPMADAKNLELKAHVGKTVPEWLVGDASRLRQVVLNLLNNAIKFTPSGTVEATLECVSRSGDHAKLRLEIVDTGVGIADEDKDKLFARFTQGDTSISRKFGGTGLGLAISKRIVENIGGEIGLESKRGVGSTFWVVFEFPVAQGPSVAEVKTTTPTPTPTKRYLEILMVDDLDMNRDLVRLILQNAGHSVSLAHDGPQAVKMAESHRYDLILMDIQMPGIDGSEAMRRIRKLGGENAQIPIIALTADVMADQVARYKASGFTDYLGKPIDVEHLVSSVQRWASGEDRESDPHRAGLQTAIAK